MMDEKAPFLASALLPLYYPRAGDALAASEQRRTVSVGERWWHLGDLAWRWIFRLCIVFVWYIVLVHFNPLLRSWVTQDSDAGIDVPIRIQRFWGQYSPYYPAGEYTPIPTGCNITQVSKYSLAVSLELKRFDRGRQVSIVRVTPLAWCDYMRVLSSPYTVASPWSAIPVAFRWSGL